jgi:ABC-type thiamine transport system ATPase subunit
VMVTHSPEDALSGPDRAAFVDAGRVLSVAAPGELLAASDPPQIRDYLGRSPNRD